jgi:hypothetical protein
VLILSSKSFWRHLIVLQDSCKVCVEHTIGSEIVLDTPYETPRRVGHVESRVGPFGGNVRLGAILVHSLHRMYHMLKNHFGHTRWNSYVTRLKWKLVLVRLETVLILTSCTVCTECTIGSKIILDAPDGTPR